MQRNIIMKIIAGIDEAGRGPLAGPVVAAAVIMSFSIEGITDSKKISTKLRESLYQQIIEVADFGVGIASVEEIDRLNILQATMLAMQRAYDNLNKSADLVLIDGNKAPKINCSDVRTVIGGDALVMQISAASIVAKDTRDRMMAQLDKQFPQYLWAKNAGYGSKAHLNAIAEFGISQHHRLTFAPIKHLVNK